jgi:hypothetical protein
LTTPGPSIVAKHGENSTGLSLAHDLIGKPVPTFPDHAVCWRMIFSESRFPLFRIMLFSGA